MTDRELEQIAHRIGHGHAFEKHVLKGGEFPDISNREQFSKLVLEVLMNPEFIKDLVRGRRLFWKGSLQTAVIVDLNHVDLGTAFRPSDTSLPERLL